MAPDAIHLSIPGLVCYNQTDWSILISNTFALPEIVYGVSLVFSPHVLLFIILFYVHAFEAPHLTSMEDLRRLLVEGGRQEMPLPLKKEMDNYYVFPKVDVIAGQPRILWETPMNGSTLDAQLRTSSEIHGFLNHFFSHQFRYGGGDLLDKSGEWTINPQGSYFL